MNRIVSQKGQALCRAAAVVFLTIAGLLLAAPPAPPPLDQLLKDGGVELVFYDRAECCATFPA